MFRIVFSDFTDGSGVALPNHAEIKLLPQATCAHRYGLLADSHEVKSYVSIEDSVICAMAEENGTDSCWVCKYCVFILYSRAISFAFPFSNFFDF